ncbi:MAG: hypothetical protein UT84_C0005G0027 [Candidatus Curtissbacteria bacterium GW2011_GWA1_40_16]|uniref:Uncharacterized protein n=1 Tax=Candidatus Curtissbacteria bacterium GW2011_GWA1_40_16 TaxID=1618405 RepID=A0A0G0RLV5_9BACT|nr:MAG: hypothetical protein UT84_C0005G0027 [Candidatus Curtissbacteria bacterium GW2011_GWA1_40_16]
MFLPLTVDCVLATGDGEAWVASSVAPFTSSGAKTANVWARAFICSCQSEIVAPRDAVTSRRGWFETSESSIRFAVTVPSAVLNLAMTCFESGPQLNWAFEKSNEAVFLAISLVPWRKAKMLSVIGKMYTPPFTPETP